MPVHPFKCHTLGLWLGIQQSIWNSVCTVMAAFDRKIITNVVFKTTTVEKPFSVSFISRGKSRFCQPVSIHPPLKSLAKQRSNYSLTFIPKRTARYFKKSAHLKNSPKNIYIYCFVSLLWKPPLDAAASARQQGTHTKKEIWNSSKSFKSTCSQLKSRQNIKLMYYF